MGTGEIVNLIFEIFERGLPVAEQIKEFVKKNPDATASDVIVEIHRISPAYIYKEPNK